MYRDEDRRREQREAEREEALTRHHELFWFEIEEGLAPYLYDGRFDKRAHRDSDDDEDFDS